MTFRCYYEFTFQFPCKKALDFDEPAVTYNNRSLGVQKHNKGVKRTIWETHTWFEKPFSLSDLKVPTFAGCHLVPVTWTSSTDYRDNEMLVQWRCRSGLIVTVYVQLTFFSCILGKMSFKDQCIYWHNYFRTLHQVNTWLKRRYLLKTLNHQRWGFKDLWVNVYQHCKFKGFFFLKRLSQPSRIYECISFTNAYPGSTLF